MAISLIGPPGAEYNEICGGAVENARARSSGIDCFSGGAGFFSGAIAILVLKDARDGKATM